MPVRNIKNRRYFLPRQWSRADFSPGSLIRLKRHFNLQGLHLIGRLSLLAAGLLITSCSVAQPMRTPSSYTTQTKWYRAASEKPSGSVLVVHGLNNRPEIMDPLIGVINQTGFDALLVTLRGHNGEEGELAAVELDDWPNDIKTGFSLISSEGRSSHLAVLAFSLGGIAAIESTKREFTSPKPDSLILIAPPLALSARSNLIRLMLPGRFFNLGLPSLTPNGYRIYDHTPLKAYNTTFDLIRSVENDPGQIARTTPTSIFVSAEDEMVSLAGIRHWLKNKQLNNWTVEELRPKAEIKPSFAHLVVDEPTLGTAEWQRLCAEIKTILQSSLTSGPVPR